MAEARVKGAIWMCPECGHSADNGGRLSIGSDGCGFALREVSVEEWRGFARSLSLTPRGRALLPSLPSSISNG